MTFLHWRQHGQAEQEDQPQHVHPSDTAVCFFVRYQGCYVVRCTSSAVYLGSQADRHFGIPDHGGHWRIQRKFWREATSVSSVSSVVHDL